MANKIISISVATQNSLAIPKAVCENLPTILLINPPLWSAFSPYLAIPLLAGVMRARGKPVQCLDLNIEFVDLLLSASGIQALSELLEKRKPVDKDDEFSIARAKAVLPAVLKTIDTAKEKLKSARSLTDDESYFAAHNVIRDALRIVSAAFESLEFDLTTGGFKYLPPSTEAIRKAVADPNSLYAWGFAQLLPQAIQDPSIKLVGISITADTQLAPAVTAAHIIKKLRPDIKIVAGGNYTTRMVNNWKGAQYPFSELLDFCILYEGEESLPMLYERLFEGRTGDIPGLTEVIDGKSVHQDAVKVDFEYSVAPAYDLYPLNKYIGVGPVLPVFSSRGCAWKCTFCSIPYASGKFRIRSPEQVAQEVVSLCEKFGTNYFMFVDEIMTLRSLREISRELIKLGSPIFWYAETRFSRQMTPEDAKEMFAGGCRRLDFGLESYNQRILDLMRKDIDISYIEPNLEACLQAGISFHLFVIFGFPTETLEETKNTISFCETMISRSRDVYRNEYSSWGPSEFTVDVFSEVGQFPGKFGIALLDPPDGHDLDLVRRINRLGSDDVLHGINSGINGRMINASAIRQFAHFHEAQRKISEEEVFLRSCLGIPEARSVTRKERVWPKDISESEVSLKERVTFAKIDFSFKKAASGRAAVFYDQQTSCLIEVEYSSEDIEDIEDLRLPQSGTDLLLTLDRLFGSKAADILGSLLRFDMLNFPAQPLELNLDELNFDCLHSEDYTHATEAPSGLFVVSSITGMALALDKVGALIWGLIDSEHGLSKAELQEILDLVEDKVAIFSLLRLMITQGLCFAHADSMELMEMA